MRARAVPPANRQALPGAHDAVEAARRLAMPSRSRQLTSRRHQCRRLAADARSGPQSRRSRRRGRLGLSTYISTISITITGFSEGRFSIR